MKLYNFAIYESASDTIVFVVAAEDEQSARRLIISEWEKEYGEDFPYVLEEPEVKDAPGVFTCWLSYD